MLGYINDVGRTRGLDGILIYQAGLLWASSDGQIFLLAAVLYNRTVFA